MFHGIDSIDDYVKDEKDTEDDCEKHKQDQDQEQGERHDKGTVSNEEDTENSKKDKESNEEEKESNEEEKEGNGESFKMKSSTPRNGSSASQLPQPIVTPLKPTAAKHMCKCKASFTPLAVRRPRRY